MGFRFGFQLDQLGEAGGATLAQAFTEVVDQSSSDVVLIIDEVQQAITTDEGNQTQTRHPRRRPFSRHRLPSRSGEWAYGPAQSGLCRRGWAGCGAQNTR
jgi:hypothetical protein